MNAVLLAVGLTVAAVMVWPSWAIGDPRGSGSDAQGLRRLRRLRRWWAGPGRGVLDGPSTGDVADTLVLLAVAVRSGLGLTDALAQVERCSGGRVREDLAAVVAALRWGRSASEAWAYAGASWRPAALAWVMAERTGAPAADLLDRAAARQRRADEQEADRRAARAGVLLVLPLGLGFLPAFVCMAVIPVVLALARGALVGAG